MDEENSMFDDEWELVIGLEVHLQLSCSSKMFGAEPYSFGGDPNSYIGVVSTGQPGSLPVVNRKAIYKAVCFGVAIDADIAPLCRFDRKSYFYPDNPKNFQITQFESPIIRGGKLFYDLDSESKSISVHHAHLEEDTATLKHFADFSGIDYNRAGVPLLEIVSEPAIHSAAEAAAYVSMIQSIAEYMDVATAHMEEGGLRIDANISVRKKGEKGLRNKMEIKNMNSIAHMEAALKQAADEQIQFYRANPRKTIEKSTFRFDADKGQLLFMRKKEGAKDYRYLPEPDIPPIILSKEYIDKIRRGLPELPKKKYDRYRSEYQLSSQSAWLIANSKPLANYFEKGMESCSNSVGLANWITVEFAGRLKDSGTSIWNGAIPSSHIAQLVNLIEEGTITGKMAKEVADRMVADPSCSPKEIINSNLAYRPIQEEATLERLIDQVISSYPDSVADFKSGKRKAFDFLIGQAMNLSKGTAPPAEVDAILKKKLNS